MSNLNNNFLEEEIEYEDDNTSADEVLEELIEEEVEEPASQASSVVNEAMKRIEQANLYKALLDHQLFAPGSARPEIIAAVRKEFKTFILSRLEILLGIKPDNQQVKYSQPIPVKLPFTDEEVSAIKALAKRLVDKEKASTINAELPPQPKIQSLTVSTPVVTTPVVMEDEFVQPKKIIKKVVRRAVQQQSEPEPAPVAKSVKKPKRAASGNVSEITGQELSQVVNPAMPPLKMPSQAQMDMMNAQQAESNSRAATRDGVGKAITAVLGK